MADDNKPARRTAADPVIATPGLGEAGNLLRDTIDELGRMLDSKHVVGQPMVFGDTTVIPLVSMGFAFGAGGGGGNDEKSNAGGGGGGGGGGGVKPIAVIVIGPQGVQLVPVPEAPSGLDRLGGAIATALKSRGDDDGDED